MATAWSERRIAKAMALIIAAALKGERCPMTQPHGPLEHDAIGALIDLGMIHSELSGRNFRQVFILTGEHAGKSTAPNPTGRPVWMIDGRHVDPNRHHHRQEPSAPQALAKTGT